MSENKQCRKCGEIKPVSCFFVDRTRNDGYKHDCKGCESAKASYKKKLNKRLDYICNKYR